MHSHGHNKLNFCHSQQFRIKFLNIVLFQYLEKQWGSKNRLVAHSNIELQSNGPILKCHLNTRRVRWYWIGIGMTFQDPDGRWIPVYNGLVTILVFRPL